MDGKILDDRLPKGLLLKFQALEYLRAFLHARSGWDYLDVSFIISGAFGVFKRSVVVAAGGYASSNTFYKTVADDLDIVFRLHRYCLENKIPYRISFAPDATAWSFCPETLKSLGRQRQRWQQGLLEVMTQHKKIICNGNYGLLGLYAAPYAFFLEGLGPIIEILGYFVFFLLVFLDMAPLFYVIGFLTFAIVLGTALSFATVAIHELAFIKKYRRFSDFIQLIVLSIFENLGYRQLIQYWRMVGLLLFTIGKTGREDLKQRGF